MHQISLLDVRSRCHVNNQSMYLGYSDNEEQCIGLEMPYFRVVISEVELSISKIKTTQLNTTVE